MSCALISPAIALWKGRELLGWVCWLSRDVQELLAPATLFLLCPGGFVTRAAILTAAFSSHALVKCRFLVLSCVLRAAQFVCDLKLSSGVSSSEAPAHSGRETGTLLLFNVCFGHLWGSCPPPPSDFGGDTKVIRGMEHPLL